MATIIAFISQKGGVGKSALARALARDASKGGLTTKIADLDKVGDKPVARTMAQRSRKTSQL